ncbi:hypothetical protein [Kribbella sp. CA-294648]|uniref:hypothetical protein n=1 Tax=Kribbella sp. CA-294648 TaxID=3239948 RepID=UPI003D8CD81E
MSRRHEEFAEFVQALRDIAASCATVHNRHRWSIGGAQNAAKSGRSVGCAGPITLTRSHFLPTPPEYHCTAYDAYSVRQVDDVVDPTTRP